MPINRCRDTDRRFSGSTGHMLEESHIPPGRNVFDSGKSKKESQPLDPARSISLLQVFQGSLRLKAKPPTGARRGRLALALPSRKLPREDSPPEQQAAQLEGRDRPATKPLRRHVRVLAPRYRPRPFPGLLRPLPLPIRALARPAPDPAQAGNPQVSRLSGLRR